MGLFFRKGYIKASFISLSVLACGSLSLLFGQNYNDSVVARFGNFKITLEEYRTAYLDVVKKPNVFDSRELREQFLDEMISTRLIASESKRLEFDKDALFNYRINAYKNKCLREAHYDAVIRPQIKVVEKEIEEAYQFGQEERNLSHLFFKTKAEADSVYDLLIKGAKFEDLAKSVFSDSLLKNNGGNLGWVNWEQLDYDLADAAFKQIPDVFSKPIKSQYGYHILRVVDFKKKPLITAYEYEIQKEKTKYLVEYKKGEQLSFEYISGLLKNAKITLYPKTVTYLEKKMAEQFKRKPDPKNARMEFQLSEEEVNRVETSVWDSKNEIVATVNGKNLTIGEFISNLNFIPYEVVYSNFSKTLDYSIRDFIITQEALKMGLETNDKVQVKTNLYNEFYLRVGLTRKIVAGVTVSEDEIKSYFNEHRPKFKDAPYDTCKPVIRDLLKKSKVTKVIPDYIRSLEKGMEVTKNTDMIHRYYDFVLKRKVN